MAYHVSVRRKTEFVFSKMPMPDIVMAFIGESGSGKSTCINYFANYFTDSSFDHRNHYANVKIVIPNHLFPRPNFVASRQQHTERDVHDNTMSQTQDCIAYDFLYNGDNIKIIDTPGFNDTDSNKDDQNIQKILKQFSQLPFITAIIVLINGTNIRLSTSIKTTLTQLRGSLPDSVFNNLFFIFTNCTEDTRNFDLNLISEFNPLEERIFHMQNSLFSIKDMNILNNDKLVRRMALTWEESLETMSELMKKIKQTSATSVQEFEEMRIRRDQLLVHKENLILRQKSLLDIMKQLDIERDRLRNAKIDQQASRNFTEEKKISVIEIEKKSYYSTLCTQHGKIQVCHENCSLLFQPNFNFAHFKHCAAADGDNCRHCKCGMNEHQHSYEIPVSRWKTIEEIVHSKKAAYDKATKDVRMSNSKSNQLDLARIAFQNDVDQIKDDIMKTIAELKQICSNFNFPEEMKGTIEKLRKEAKIATDMRAKEEFNNTADAIEQISINLTSKVQIRKTHFYS